MATFELQQSSSNHDDEVQISSSGGTKRGGWITFLFIAGTVMGLTLASWGWLSNLIVCLIEEFNVKSVDAAQISNIVNGCICVFAIAAAIVADSFFGSFSVIFFCSSVNLLGLTLFSLTAMLDSLRPPHCETGLPGLCQSPSRVQFVVLYFGLALLSVGTGGTRSVITTMGANQLHRLKYREIYFNWFLFVNCAGAAIGSTAIVYVEDNLIGLVIFLSGRRFYCYDTTQGSPFVDLTCVVVACFRKRKVLLSSRSEDYYYGNDGKENTVSNKPEKNFRILNRAAMKTEGDLKEDGSVAKPWRLCTVQRVEDVKSLLGILPLWSSSLLVSTPIAIQGSLTVLQALTMDRHLSSYFKIPAGSFGVIVFISTSISLLLVDRVLYPMWRKLSGRSPTTWSRPHDDRAFHGSLSICGVKTPQSGT
ncbi:Nitrate excretion transporter 1 [Morus notabilis]|uniref:Nitrate excretion transporter 1 n=1 Tax=Morus notabilis TaxID=981085 RepID=W9SIG6_9ROSA|nr:Nitrate excretion transporter 1 [Morus notabilis]